MDDSAPQAVIGDSDERVRVSLSGVNSYPWNTIGYYRMEYPNNDRARCTAFLVGPHLALTNGHCTYSHSRDSWIRAATLSPGQYQSDEGESVIRPFGTQPAYNWATNNGWMNSPGDRWFDYAALFFSRTFSNIDTYMPLVFDLELARILNISGYPARIHMGTDDEEDPTFSQWRSSSDESGSGGDNDRLAYYDADTSGGNSGSPIWRLTDGNRRVLGIHCCHSTCPADADGLNCGPRLVSQNQSLIESWLDWEPPAEPGPADDFGEESLPSDVTGIQSSSNLGATLEIEEPDHCGEVGGRSMWWSWTAPRDRTMRFFTPMSETDFNVILAAYTLSAFGTLNERACDTNGSATEISFDAQKGKTYHIVVDGRNRDEGDFELHWTPEGPPDNDDFADRWSMEGNTGTTKGDNIDATRESSESQTHCDLSTHTSVWWSFQSPDSIGLLEIDSLGSDFDVILGVYVGNSVDALTEVACDGSFGNSKVALRTEPGEKYRVVVAGVKGTEGEIQLNWNWDEMPDLIFRDQFELEFER